MFDKAILGNTGIEVICEVEDKKIIKIVEQVSTRLMVAFPNSNLNYLDIYKTLLDTPMYYARIPNGLSKVNYYYKNSSIYFSENIDVLDVDEYILHECIHKLQERKDKKGNITRLGVCEINELSVKGAALNEGAIQYVTAKALKSPLKTVKVYDLNLPSKTEYYPIITNIISQIAYLLGDEILIDSTINGKEDFKIQIIDDLGENEYNNIEKNLNEILKIKNEIMQLQNNEKTDEITEKISNNIILIRKIYFDTQNLIYTSFFDDNLIRTENEFEVNMLKQKLYSYRSYIGTGTGYNDFNLYCIGFEKRANDKIKELKNKMALTVIKDNIFYKIFRNLKRLFKNSTNEYYK